VTLKRVLRDWSTASHTRWKKCNDNDGDFVEKYSDVTVVYVNFIIIVIIISEQNGRHYFCTNLCNLQGMILD
jgi:hypothetical protein